jgi:cell division protein FtsL
VKTPQRLHRELDPRVRRALGAALALSALLVAGALGAVATQVHQVRLAYRLDALRVEKLRLEETLRQLEVEVATLGAPARLEARARQLGLTAPSREQVHLAREFVTGSTGLAALRSRTAMQSRTSLPQ